MKLYSRIVLPVLLTMGLASAAYAGESYGTQPQTPPPQAQPEVDASQFSQDDLQKFASVQQDLEVIREEYSQKLESAGDQQQAQQLQQEASQTMVQAVQSEGLDIETYTQIAKAVRNDETLRELVIQMMN